MALTVPDLQGLLRNAARQASDPNTYSYFQQDAALISALREWLRLTKTTNRLSTMTLTAGSTALPSFPVGFLPNLLVDAYLTLSGSIVQPGVNVTTIEEVLQRQFEISNGSCYPGATPPTSPPSGRPTMLGFSSLTAGITDYLPDAAYTVNLWWAKKITAWTRGQAFVTATVSGGAITGFTIQCPGSIYSSAPTITVAESGGSGFVAGTVTLDARGGVATIAVSAGGTGYVSPVVSVNGVSAATITFDLTDEELESVAELGAVYFLQRTEPNNKSEAAEAYTAFRERARQTKASGIGSKGPQVLVRKPALNPDGSFA